MNASPPTSRKPNIAQREREVEEARAQLRQAEAAHNAELREEAGAELNAAYELVKLARRHERELTQRLADIVRRQNARGRTTRDMASQLGLTHQAISHMMRRARGARS